MVDVFLLTADNTTMTVMEALGVRYPKLKIKKIICK